MIDIQIYLIVVGVALLIDTFVPDFNFVWKYIKHPVVVLGGLISILEKALYKKSKFNGLIMWVLTVAIWGGLGFGIEYIIFTYTDYGIYISILIVTITLASFALKLAVKKVMIGLDKGDIKTARINVSHLCSRDTTKMDKNLCASASLESLSENLSDGVIAPALFYGIFGLAGLFVYKGVNTLDSMIGYKSDKYKKFGYVSARLDDVANYIPARVCVILIVIASLFHKNSKTIGIIGAVRKFAKTHNSPNAGFPESGFAEALQISMGGKRTYADIGEVEKWIGDGNKNITSQKIYDGIKLFNWVNIVASVFFVAVGLYLF